MDKFDLDAGGGALEGGRGWRGGEGGGATDGRLQDLGICLTRLAQDVRRVLCACLCVCVVYSLEEINFASFTFYQERIWSCGRLAINLEVPVSVCFPCNRIRTSLVIPSLHRTKLFISLNLSPKKVQYAKFRGRRFKNGRHLCLKSRDQLAMHCPYGNLMISKLEDKAAIEWHGYKDSGAWSLSYDWHSAILSQTDVIIYVARYRSYDSRNCNFVFFPSNGTFRRPFYTQHCRQRCIIRI